MNASDRAARPRPTRPAMAVAALAALAVGAGACLAATRRRRPHPPTGRRPLGVRSTGRLGRGLELARMGSRAGTAYVSGSARQVFASAARREELAAERQLRTTAEVVETLGSMKGAFMKLGQMASYLDAGLDPEVRRQLARLQADAPPMAAELAASVVRSELGADPDALFAEWDPVPIAAASIGQVHRAITGDGRAVAVKVQYPGVDEAIRSDLDNSATLLAVIRLAFPSLDAEALVAELRDRIGEELDYGIEARNQAMFAAYFAGHPFIHVPEVVGELSTTRVLTSELVAGARYEEAVGWSQEERDLAGETIFRFVFGGLYSLNVFNGDPHPGNYLFHGGGRVTFLDFGLVKWFDRRDVELLGEMVRAAVTAPDAHRFRRAVEAAGFLRPDESLSDDEVADYFRHYYEIALADEVVRFTPEYASETLRHFFDAGNPVLKRANVPPPFVLLQRINLGLYAVLAGLGACGNWRRVAEEVWPWVAAPPSTELGWAEEEWRRRTGRSRFTRLERPPAPPGPASPQVP
ncbi:MAG TPA: AarF/ABC1/UbiB kinase family protein [Acidimicrobiales bacterium]|nr:AarF/ABC1/UbiB kinase family protein [Acidimicrobiales bacterium]